MRGFFFVAAGFSLALVACGGGTTVLTPAGRAPTRAPSTTAPTTTPTTAPTPGSTGSPPASLAAITPAPGFPTAPPLNVSLVAPTAYPSTSASTSATALPTTLSYAQLSAQPPPSAVTSALVAALPTPSGAALILGNITSFTSNGLVVSTTPLLNGTSNSNGTSVPYPGVTAPPSVTLTVGGTTVDGVPGGLGSMRIGDAVLAAAVLNGAAASTQYLTDLTLLGAHATYQRVARTNPDDSQASLTSNLSPAITGGNGASGRSSSNPRRLATRRRDAAEPVQFFLYGQQGASSMLGMNGKAFAAPLVLPSAQIDVGWGVIGALGAAANYPLLLEDESDSLPWAVDTAEALPIAVLNPTGADTGPTYGIAGQVLVYFSASMTYSYPQANGTPSSNTAYFSTTPEQEPLVTMNETKLLPTGASPAPLPTSSPAIYSADVGAAADALLAQLAPSSGSVGSAPVTLQMTISGNLTGGPLDSAFDISNTMPSSIPATFFNVDTDPIADSDGSTAPFTLEPTGSPTVVQIVGHSAVSPANTYNGMLTLNGSVTIQAPVSSPPEQTQPFNPLALAGATGFAAAFADYDPAPSISLEPTEPTTCVAIKNISSGFNDGGGTSNCNTNDNDEIAFDITTNAPPNTTATAQVTVTDSILVNGAVDPNLNGQVIIDESDLPPASIVPNKTGPHTCPSQGVTISPLSFSGSSQTITITLPPNKECDFEVVDKYGAFVYYDITNSG